MVGDEYLQGSCLSKETHGVDRGHNTVHDLSLVWPANHSHVLDLECGKSSPIRPDHPLADTDNLVNGNYVSVSPIACALDLHES